MIRSHLSLSKVGYGKKFHTKLVLRQTVQIDVILAFLFSGLVPY